MVNYDYEPHSVDRTAPVTHAEVRGMHHEHWLMRLNAKIGLKVTFATGTMWTAYFFTLIALFALPDAIKQGTYFIVVWLSSSFLQLVLLPVIIVGQNIQAKAADARAETTFKDAEAILCECLELQKHLQAQDEVIAEIVVALTKGP